MKLKIFHLLLIISTAGASIANFAESHIDAALLLFLFTIGLLPLLIRSPNEKILFAYLSAITAISFALLLLFELRFFYRLLIGIVGLSALTELLYRLLKLKKS